MKTKTISITISGVTPLLLNRFTEEAQLKASESGGSSSVGESKTPLEDAEARLYTYPLNGGKAVPVIPQPNLFKCIIEGGRFFKLGRSKITTQKSSLIPGCVVVGPEVMKIIHTDPWVVDTRPIRNPVTGGRRLRHRPMFHDWSLAFEAQIDIDLLGEKLFREIVDAAGQRIGLGDFRPDCKGPYGRFVVTIWKVKK